MLEALLVHEAPYPVNTNPQGKENAFEVDFLVHSSQVGGIIGLAGFKIKQLREETQAAIKVYQECLPDSTERVIAIGGEEDHIVAALTQMLDIMQEEPIKGNITLYDPSYDHSQGFEDNYNYNFNGPPRGGMGGGPRGGMRGGRGGPRGGMRGGMGGPPGGPGNFGPGPQGGFGGGNAGGNGMMGGPQDNSFGNNYGNNYGNNQFNQGPPQGDNTFGAAGGNFGATAGNFGATPGGDTTTQGNGTTTTTQVTIPNDMAGAIIGKGGERIRGIRQKCGADIKFSDSDPGKKDRLITISGSQDQIQYAQYLMQQCVRQHHHS